MPHLALVVWGLDKQLDTHACCRDQQTNRQGPAIGKDGEREALLLQHRTRQGLPLGPAPGPAARRPPLCLCLLPARLQLQ